MEGSKDKIRSWDDGLFKIEAIFIALTFIGILKE